MKKLAFILLSALAISCGEETAPKPEHLISEDEMLNILYDVSLLQSLKSFKPQVLDSSHVDPRKYIYTKYKIDSLTLVQNHTWYASDLEKYEKMQRKVSERLQKEHDKLVPKNKSNKPINPGTAANPAGTPGQERQQQIH